MHSPDSQLSLRIMVVDDNADHADSLLTMLAIRGYDAQAAYSSAAAIEQAATQRFDVAILDLVLPTMDGYELATRLRASCPGLVLMAMSAHVGDAYQEKGAGGGYGALFRQACRRRKALQRT